MTVCIYVIFPTDLMLQILSWRVAYHARQMQMIPSIEERWNLSYFCTSLLPLFIFFPLFFSSLLSFSCHPLLIPCVSVILSFILSISFFYCLIHLLFLIACLYVFNSPFMNSSSILSFQRLALLLLPIREIPASILGRESTHQMSVSS